MSPPCSDAPVHDLLLVELLDVEYYIDLEMWVRGHSMSLKVVPFGSLGMVSYSYSIAGYFTEVPKLQVSVNRLAK